VNHGGITSTLDGKAALPKAASLNPSCASRRTKLAPDDSQLVNAS
jgi:hypothetical protein